VSEKESNKKLFGDVRQLIESAKNRIAATVNAELTLLYWQVGKRISDEILKGERGEYGKQIVAGLSHELSVRFGRGWSKRNLTQMIKFAEEFPDFQIVQTLSAQLSWSHFVSLISIADPLKREFYLTMATEERWSIRTLVARIDSQLGTSKNTPHRGIMFRIIFCRKQKCNQASLI